MLKTALRVVQTPHFLRVTRTYATTHGTDSEQPFPPDINQWSHPPTNATVSDEEIYRLAAKPRRPLTLADLVK